MDYYKKKQLLAQVDKNDVAIDYIDKWEAHEKGILHRAFTIALYYQDQLIFQHRKHPVFDGVFDLGCSSHPYLIGDKMQVTMDGVYEALEREWGLVKKNLKNIPTHKGSVYYKATDKYSVYKEHEVCHLYVVHTKTPPLLNKYFAYGFTSMKTNEIIGKKTPITTAFAPWVPPLLELL